MKLWQKISIYSLLFFLAVFLCSGIAMIENNKRTAFDRALRQADYQQTSISSGIMYQVMLNRAKHGVDSVSADVESITEYLDSQMSSFGIYLAIREGEKVLYSNLDFVLPQIGKAESVTTYRVWEIDQKKFLVLTSKIPVKYRDFQNIYLMDVSTIYEDRKLQYAFFIRLSIVVAILLTAGMYMITGQATKPLRVLTESVKKIGNGNYKERVEVRSKDEVGRLAESYNEMAEAIEEKINELEQLTGQQRSFIDNFTHELRTPLTTVIGYADLLRSTSYSEEFSRETGERIFREGKRIEKLSELMMELVFLERHSFRLRPQNAAELIAETIKRLKPAMEKKQVELVGVLPAQPAVICGERELLLILLGNLVDNAGKASKKGDTIRVLGDAGAQQIVLTVQDEGKGIPEEEKERVFESFYMLDEARKRKNGGLGLGLSICREIAKIHGAQIELDSEVGKGTSVKIIFPCYNPDTVSPYDHKKTYHEGGKEHEKNQL